MKAFGPKSGVSVDGLFAVIDTPRRSWKYFKLPWGHPEIKAVALLGIRPGPDIPTASNRIRSGWRYWLWPAAEPNEDRPLCQRPCAGSWNFPRLCRL